VFYKHENWSFSPQVFHNKIVMMRILRLREGEVGHAVARAVNRQLPAESRVRAHVKWCGICDSQVSQGQGFSRVLPLSLPIVILLNASYSYLPLLVRKGQSMADLTSEVSLTPPQPTKLKKEVQRWGHYEEKFLMKAFMSNSPSIQHIFKCDEVKEN
jgi:hypothetical protein